MSPPAATTERQWRYGVPPREDLARRSGLAFLAAIGDGSLPAPPIGETLDFEPGEMSAGRAEFVGRPSLRHYNPLGTVHGGVLATLLDSCMGCAVHTLLDAGEGYATLELKVNFVRAVTAETGPLRAVGTVVHRGRRSAVAEGRLLDARGRLLAHGTTTCLVFPLDPDTAEERP